MTEVAGQQALRPLRARAAFAATAPIRFASRPAEDGSLLCGERGEADVRVGRWPLITMESRRRDGRGEPFAR